MDKSIKCKKLIDLTVEQRCAFLDSFENCINSNLVDSLYTNWNDSSNTMYYAVFVDSTPLFFFSLRASSVYSQKIEFTEAKINAAKLAMHIATDNKFNLNDEQDYSKYVELLQKHKLIPASISWRECSNRIAELEFIWRVTCDLKKGSSIAIYNRAIPCIELVEFCKCTSEKSKNAWEAAKIPVKLGTYVFYVYIAQILAEVCKSIGCSLLMLYAADGSTDGSLLRNYRTEMDMSFSDEIVSVKPAYDVSCTLLVQQINNIIRRRYEFLDMLDSISESYTLSDAKSDASETNLFT